MYLNEINYKCDSIAASVWVLLEYLEIFQYNNYTIIIFDVNLTWLVSEIICK